MATIDGATAQSLAVDARVRYVHRDEFGYHFALA